MPVFKDYRNTKEVSLSSIPGSKIILFDKVITGDLLKLQSVENDFERAIKLLACLIKEWNLTNEQGNSLPVEETLKNFDANDVAWLVEQSGLGKSLGKAKSGQ